MGRRADARKLFEAALKPRLSGVLVTNNDLRPVPENKNLRVNIMTPSDEITEETEGTTFRLITVELEVIAYGNETVDAADRVCEQIERIISANQTLKSSFINMLGPTVSEEPGDPLLEGEVFITRMFYQALLETPR